MNIVTNMTRWAPEGVAARLREAARVSLAATSSPGNVPGATDALCWLDWLDPDLGRLVRARAEGARWKLICWRFGISRVTAHRRFRRGLVQIAEQLNQRLHESPGDHGTS